MICMYILPLHYLYYLLTFLLRDRKICKLIFRRAEADKASSRIRGKRHVFRRRSKRNET